ncbi:MAG: hypothetical protein IJB05_07120 [Bacteroidales bacterium]|nr:hypothetical protein [Bacteroidales bacterium]
MKRFMTILCAIALFGASLSAQEADTLVVIVKHDNSGNTFFEKVGKPFKKGYKAVETGVVNGYKAVENAFVEPFCDTISTSRMYARKYRADIELSWSNPNTWGITSSHGYSFGNGLYVGGGAGFAAEWNGKDEPLYLVPVFADVKYSFINRLASPFVSLKGGAYADITNSGLRTFANPAVGVDIGRFSIKVGYEYQLGCWGNGDGVHTHQVKCGVGFTF